MPLKKIREYILENPNERVDKTIESSIKVGLNTDKREGQEVYIRENICDIFEIHYLEKNREKYGYIIENVKKYVEKMLED